MTFTASVTATSERLNLRAPGWRRSELVAERKVAAFQRIRFAFRLCRWLTAFVVELALPLPVSAGAPARQPSTEDAPKNHSYLLSPR